MDAMEKLDPSTIESFSVLKDSASIKVYGKRGANGVILNEAVRLKYRIRKSVFHKKQPVRMLFPIFRSVELLLTSRGVRRLESALLCLIQIMVR